MNYLTGSYTDVGIKKKTNQDSYSVKVARTPYGNVALVVICDGMGGLEKGEVASSYVIGRFDNWFKTDFSLILKEKAMDNIEYQWNNIVQSANEKIAHYGNGFNVTMGTTLTVALFYDSKCYVMHVGDTRLYRITDAKTEILTEDQTLVAREVRRGNMTPQQAEADPRRNVLLQCIGASRVVEPQYIVADVAENEVYMLCSDGFRHKISEQEIHNAFSPGAVLNKDILLKNEQMLVELNKNRHETDNITVLAVKTY